MFGQKSHLTHLILQVDIFSFTSAFQDTETAYFQLWASSHLPVAVVLPASVDEIVESSIDVVKKFVPEYSNLDLQSQLELKQAAQSVVEEQMKALGKRLTGELSIKTDEQLACVISEELAKHDSMSEHYQGGPHLSVGDHRR